MGGDSHRLPSLTYTVQREENLILNLLCNFRANHLRIGPRASARAGIGIRVGGQATRRLWLRDSSGDRPLPPPPPSIALSPHLLLRGSPSSPLSYRLPGLISSSSLEGFGGRNSVGRWMCHVEGRWLAHGTLLSPAWSSGWCSRNLTFPSRDSVRVNLGHLGGDTEAPGILTQCGGHSQKPPEGVSQPL